MKLIIQNAKIVNPSIGISFRGSLFINNGIIKTISKDQIVEKDSEVINADGLIVAPGFIDTHVHFRDPGFEYKEDIISGLNAAARGGFTAVCSMPNTNPVADNAQTIDYMISKAKSGSGVKLYPFASATTGLEGKEISPIGELKEHGAVAVSDDGKPVANTALLYRVMQYAATHGLKYASHSEDKDLADGGQMNESEYSTLFGLKGIPVVAEASQIARECMLAEYLDLPIHFQHVSAKMSVEIIEFYKNKGVKVTAEATPHHLILTDKYVESYSTNTKMNPPLRSEADRLSLLDAVKKGIIDNIATDHAPHHEREKNVEFNAAPFGITGLETALPLILKFYHDGTLSIEKVVELFTNGYQIFDIPGGVIKEGAPADITVIDPDVEYKIDIKEMRSKSKNTPFEGFDVKGEIYMTIVDGKIIYKRERS